ncbi:hypothetical protein [Salinifilum aidingensis]
MPYLLRLDIGQDLTGARWVTWQIARALVTFNLSRLFPRPRPSAVVVSMPCSRNRKPIPALAEVLQQ